MKKKILTKNKIQCSSSKMCVHWDPIDNVFDGKILKAITLKSGIRQGWL